MVDKHNKPRNIIPKKGTNEVSNVKAFLQHVASTSPLKNETDKHGRLIFAMDATASRQHSWDQAAAIQGQMFHETASLGGLDIQLVFYRGFGEFKVSKWTDKEVDLNRWMTSVQCRAGETQLSKVLTHAANETQRKRVNALVFIGDSCEEDVDYIGNKAGELGLKGVPAFIFHEGHEPIAGYIFKEVARLTNGAYCSFDKNSASSLRNLLTAVAVYAAGGLKALGKKAKRDGGAVLQIVNQINID